MKKIRCFLIAFILLLALIVTYGCNNTDDVQEKTASAYGIVHDNYVGVATITVDDSKTTSLSIDEAFLPHDWASLTSPTSGTNVFIASDEKPYAKYICIDTIIFKASSYDSEQAEADGTTKQKVKYSADGIDNLFNYVKNEDNAKWYIEALKNNKAFISDNEGKKLKDFTGKYTTKFKSEGEYWPQTDTMQGWNNNISKLIDAIKQTNFSETPVKNSEGYITFGDVVTTATITDFLEYYELSKKAYEKAK